MRKLVTIAFALICFQLMASPASAKSIRIGVLVSSSTLRLKCSEANSVFRENASGHDCYAPGGTINCDGGGRCLGSCSNCVKASSQNVTGVLKPAPVPSKAGTSVVTVNGNTIVRDHRTASGATPRSAAPAAPNAAPVPSPVATATNIRDHRKK
jgi:hypothetical protein